MFRNFKVTLLAGGIVLVAGAAATSALTTVSADRALSLNLVDDSANAAVNMECINDYSDLCQKLANGNISLDLNQVLVGAADGFNRNATFTIGSAKENERVFRLTNNTDSPLKLYFEGAGAVSMIAARGEGASEALTAEGSNKPMVVASGEAREFYFQIVTPDSGNKIDGTLKVR
jgi:hypothetical protein